MTAAEIVEKLSANFYQKVGEWHEMKASPYMTRMGSYMDVTDASFIRDICLFLRDEPDLVFNNLMLLSSLDNGDKTFSVVYHLESMTLKHIFALKVTVPEANPIVPSVVSVWNHANWQEREAWDMMGLQFQGHPDLRRILLDEDYPGFPLRKDFKTPEFFRGMKVPY
jgi:NADH-quinone oxidoreductase subunit C